jgi:gliding motility-associated-like protein
MKTKANCFASCTAITQSFRKPLILFAMLALFHSTEVHGQCAGTIVAPPSLSYCIGEEIELVVNPTQGVPPFQVVWSTNANGTIVSTNNLEAVVIANTNTTYTATVTDDNGCVFTVTVFSEPQPLSKLFGSSIQTSLACPPAPSTLTMPTGSATIGPFTYLWSTGETTQTIQPPTSGTYLVTVTSAVGCTRVYEQLVTLPNLVEPTLSGPDGLCINTASSTLTAVNAPTTGSNTYLWSTGGLPVGANGIAINAPGTYSVTVTNFLGIACTGVATIVIPELTPTTPQPTVGGGGLCPGETTVLTLANASNYVDFDWNTNATTPSITVDAPGLYTVTVTEPNGCRSNAVLEVLEFSITDPTIVGKPDICVGQESVTLSVTPSFSQYLWSNGLTTPTITASQSGTYGVTVTDANGCITENDTELPPAFIPAPVIESGPQPCPGGIAVLIETTGPYASYLWSNGATTSSNTVAQAGTYTVTVTNSSNCTGTAQTELVFAANPTPSITVTGGGCGSSATLQASAAESYAWSTGANTQAITVAAAGTYTVTVSNSAGCIGTASTVVSPGTSAPVSVSGPASFCGGSATLTASPGFAAYAWSNGGTGASTQVSASGTYAVTATDAGGCTATASLTVTAAGLPSPPVVGPSGICPGSTAVLQVGGSFAGTAWSTGASTQSISVAAAGTYTVTVTNDLGCTASASATVEAFPAPGPAISGPTSICQGSIATLAVQGNFSGINWNTGSSAASISVGAQGTYTVTVTNASGCSATAQQSLQVGSSLSPQVAVASSGCAGPATLSVSGSFATYLWSNGSTTASTTATTPGSYAVTVSDGSGCTGTATVAVSFPGQPQVTITGPTAVCASQPATWVAGGGFASYAWATPAGTLSTPSIQVALPGNYSLTVTDANGCTATAQQALAQLPAPTVSISGPGSICTSNAASFTAIGDYDQAIWSTGFVGPGITVAQPGTYAVTVSDANGCAATAQQSLQVGSSLSPQVAVVNGGCAGPATLSVGGNFTTYLWSNGSTTASTAATTPGSYAVTVSDGSGCTGTATVAVSFPGQPQVAITGPTAVCAGQPVSWDATGAFASYAWATPAGTISTPSIQVALPGNYSLTVTDANGCTATAQQALDLLPSPVVDISGPGSICTGSAASFTAIGDYAQAVWSTGFVGPGITVAQPGTYAVTVSDANGCSATAQQYLTVGTGLLPTASVAAAGCGGTATVTVDGDYASYLWSSGESTQSISPAAAGTYTVTISDGSGCTGTATVAVSFAGQPQVAITEPASACQGAPASFSATPGFADYAWSGPTGSSFFGQDIAISQPGTYSLTVTDANGCTATAQQALALLPTPTVSISGPGSICTGSAATFTALGDYVQATWSTGFVGTDITVVQPGTYAVTVSDANGCSATAQQSLTTGNSLAVSIEQVANCDGTALLSAVGGTGGYLWSDGSAGSSILVVQDGTYAVTVTDASGCSGEAGLTVSLPEPPQVSIQGDAGFCEGLTASLAAPANFSGYQWSTGDTTPGITVSGAGNYGLTVTDATGCTATGSWSVEQFPAQFSSVVAQSCSVQDTGTVVSIYPSFNGCDSVVALTTVFVPAITVEVSLSACAGSTATYEGTAIAAGTSETFSYVSWQGCDSIVVVTVVELPDVSLDWQAGASCWNGADGSVSVAVAEGVPPYEFSLGDSPAQPDPVFTGLAGGSYALRVVDGNGCEALADVAVPLTERTVLAVSNQVLPCAGGSLTLAPEVLVGDAGQLGWRWSDGSDGPTLEVSNIGSYGVTVSDGCEEQAFTIAVESLVSVEENGYFYVPNAFSPNGDQTNDLFRAYAGLGVEVRSFELWVFDRWGEQLFFSEDPEKGWDGVHRDRQQQGDVLVWFLRATVADCRGENLDIFRKGDVVIVR